MSNLKLQALKANYTAKRLEAIATLDVYFNASVGIGEHPQIIEEMDKLVRQIADAEGCLQVIEENFTEQPEQV
jgi:hypothetical protein